MTAILVCIAAFLVTYIASRRSLVSGIITTIAVGFSYGILRANLLSAASHFIFDSSLAALYLSAFMSRPRPEDKQRGHVLKIWLAILIVWPALLFFLPFQPFLVSLVGLRGNTFFLPVLALGVRLRNSDLWKLSYALATLNLIAFSFGVAEYFLGIERFFPVSPVTAIIYASSDAGAGFHRIPSIFANAHSYAGTMVYTLPLLLGAWVATPKSKFGKILIPAALMAALGGIMLASTRLNVILGGILVAAAIFAGRMSAKKMMLWVAILITAVTLASTNERFSRFKRLDAETIVDRASGSVNRTFLEILYDYPIGNGLGGGGTSLPYFLMGLVNNPTVSENEYARILLEEGILGLLIWICFIAWVLFNRNAFQKTEWLIARRLCYVLVLANFAVSNIGMGMLTAIPGTFIMFFMIGWIVTVPPVEEQAPDRAIQPAASRGAVPARPDKLAFPGRTIADA